MKIGVKLLSWFIPFLLWEYSEPHQKADSRTVSSIDSLQLGNMLF
jgi:hypothetical protein